MSRLEIIPFRQTLQIVFTAKPVKENARLITFDGRYRKVAEAPDINLFNSSLGEEASHHGIISWNRTHMPLNMQSIKLMPYEKSCQVILDFINLNSGNFVIISAGNIISRSPG